MRKESPFPATARLVGKSAGKKKKKRVVCSVFSPCFGEVRPISVHGALSEGPLRVFGAGENMQVKGMVGGSDVGR